MTTIATVAHEYAALLAIVIALGYCYVAAGRWRWSMAPDAGLLTLYCWRPSLGCLAFVLLLGIVRHTPRLSSELALMFRLAEYDGWTASTIHYLLPALPPTHIATGPTRVLHMSSATAGATRESGTQVVHEPVAPTSMEGAAPEVVSADTTAAERGFELPRISRHNTERELIIYLAAQVRPNGKERFSANQIADLMEGNKNNKGMPRVEVLAIVRELRETTVYRPLTEAQAQVRSELGL